MIKITKLLYILSIPTFLAVLLYVYAFLPDEVGVYFDSTGNAEILLSKANFFYLILGLFVVTNALIVIYRRMNRGGLNISKSSYDDMTSLEIIYHWLNGLSFVFNTIYIFSLMFVGMYYNSEDLEITHYLTLIYIGPVLLLGWIFWFIYLQFAKK